MRSFVLSIAIAMLLSAVYVFQNPGDITVRFMMFERVFPQGIWVVVVFSAGAILMWLFSLFASLEQRAKYRKKIAERDQKIKQLDEEKAAILEALKNQTQQTSPAYFTAGETKQQDVAVVSTPLPLQENADRKEDGEEKKETGEV